jgi:hypothetical protein
MEKGASFSLVCATAAKHIPQKASPRIRPMRSRQCLVSEFEPVQRPEAISALAGTVSEPAHSANPTKVGRLTGNRLLTRYTGPA